MGGFNTTQEAASGGGEWGDDLGTGAELDGVASLKSQSAAPSATADYAKIYATDTGPASDSNIKLLLHAVGADSSTPLDSSQSSHSVTKVGTCHVDDAIGPPSTNFGTSSILFTGGDDDYLQIGDSTDWTLDGQFAIHTWVRIDSGAEDEYRVVFMWSTGSFSAATPRLIWEGNNNRWQWGVSTGDLHFADTLTHSTWYHVAVTRDSSNNLRLFRDGVQKGSTETGVTTTYDAAGGLRIGTNYSTEESWNGNMDEFTIIKGSDNGWNGSSFTAPTSPIGNTAEMNVLDENGNATKISPHNAQGEWEYYSKNTKTGKVVRINMEEVVSDLGKLTGKDYIKHE